MWAVKKTNEDVVGQLVAAAYHPVIAALLANREVDSAEAARVFLDPAFEHLSDPFRLAGMRAAVDRLQQAVRLQEPVFIFGDSDVDGITSSVIVFEALQALGACVGALPANRIAEGYGFSDPMLQRVLASRTKLLVLTDCGTNQADAVLRLRHAGIDTVILDHHQPGTVAEPFALVNPHVDKTQGMELCSAGLAFKLAQALLGKNEALRGYLDLAAVGTLADYSPMRGENRIIVKEGVAQLAATGRPGLKRLCADTGVTNFKPETVLRKLVPRLNASGRLGDARAVWHMLRARDDATSEAWVERVEAAHVRTKQLGKQTMAQAMRQIERMHFRDRHIIVVDQKGWPAGLMGPLASQLAQRYNRPAIAIASNGGEGVGSVRSIPHLNMLEILEACREWLLRFGGHAQACGLAVAHSKMEAFKEAVNRRVGDALKAQPEPAAAIYDAELKLEDFEPGWIRHLTDFEPYGPGNRAPSFIVRRLALEKKSPRRAWVVNGHKKILLKGEVPESSMRFDLALTPALEKEGVQFTLRNIQASDEAL